jgi:hypothetical protein
VLIECYGGLRWIHLDCTRGLRFKMPPKGGKCKACGRLASVCSLIGNVCRDCLEVACIEAKGRELNDAL